MAHILLVEDDLALQQLTKDYLEHNGMTAEGIARVMNIDAETVLRRIAVLAPYNMVFTLQQHGNTSWHVESFWLRALENYLEKRQFLFRGTKL